MPTDTYKKHRTVSNKQLSRQLMKNRGGSKCCKFSPNINQLNINLLINLFVAQPAKQAGTIHGLFNVGPDAGRSSHTPGIL